MGYIAPALRRLTAAPGFVTAAVLTLALGLGTSTAIFSIVNAVLFRPLPVESPRELTALYTSGQIDFIRHLGFSYLDYLDFRDRNEVFSGLLAYQSIPTVMAREDAAEIVFGEEVSANYFQVLGVPPAAGRLFTADDGEPGASPMAVLSYRTWNRRFGGDPALIGRQVNLGGTLHTVIGVATERFTGLRKGVSSEFWKLIDPQAAAAAGRGSGDFDVVGRLAPGVTREQAQANLEVLARQLGEAYPETNRNLDVTALPLHRIAIHPDADGPIRAAAFAVMALSGLVLLIGCANLTNLLLVRALARRREVAVRIALGASRRHLIRELLTESLILGLAGGGGGLLIAVWCNHILNVVEFPLPMEIALGLAIDGRVLAFSGAMALFTSIGLGLIPAWRTFGGDLFPALRDEERMQTGGKKQRQLRHAIVAAQIALSVVLLIFGGLAARSFVAASTVNPGFNLDQLAGGSFALEFSGYDEERGRRFYGELLDRVQAQPGVQSATLTTGLPLTLSVQLTRVAHEWQRSLPVDEMPYVDTTSVWPGYFATMEIPIIDGREFVPTDATARTAIVNEAFARAYWGEDGAVGRRILVGFYEPELVEIVGVARNGKYRTLGEEARPFVYTNLMADYRGVATLLVRSRDATLGVNAIRNAVGSLDPNVPVGASGPVGELISPALLLPKYAAGIFGAFGLLGALLAVVGLYGVIAYSVSQRRREIGVRIALGAAPRHIVKMVLGEGLKLTGLGIAAGLGLAVFSTDLLASIWYGIGATDTVTFVAVSLLMLMVTAAACYQPVRRAMRVDPMTTLRT